MKKNPLSVTFLFFTALSVVLLVTGCTSSSSQGPPTPVLIEIKLNMQTATAAKGSTVQFTALGKYDVPIGFTQDVTSSVLWQSSDPSVAVVSNLTYANTSGLVTCLSAGTTTITASSGGISASTILTVTNAQLASIAVTPANPSIAAGTTQQFTATGTFSDATTLNITTSVVWSSSTTTMATISSNSGMATGIMPGTTVISATSGTISGNTTLTVTAMAGGTAPVLRTGQTTSYYPRDDGALQKGIASPSPRFTDNLNGTVTDHLTGLIWLKDTNCLASGISWSQALVSANALANGQCSLTDGSAAGSWRLPNILELHSLIDLSQYNPALPAGQPFLISATGLGNYFWSSTTSALHTGNAWVVDMTALSWTSLDKATGNNVWPVRAGGGGAADLPQTGQTTCYDPVTNNPTACANTTGQDGNLRKGVSWSIPRFTQIGNCVTDSLTGLMWAHDANLPYPNSAKLWQDAMDFVTSLNGSGGLCGYTDWRLPNVNELASLLSFQEAFPYTWLANQGFVNVQGDVYWSSTTSSQYFDSAWGVATWTGGFSYTDLKIVGSHYVWPVRGGQ